VEVLKMNEMLTRTWRMAALRGLIALLFGVLAIARPDLTLLAFTFLFSAYALITGIVLAAGAIQQRAHNDDWWIDLIMGLVSLGAGVIALIHPALTALVLVLLVGAYALVSGALDIGAAIRLRKLVRGEWMLILSGLVSMVFGVLVFLYPAQGGLAIALYVGVYALISGGLLLAFALSLRARTRKHEPAERRITADRRMTPQAV
jgi:uncharacterized membrane protein HdeD (DUF308 family)